MPAPVLEVIGFTVGIDVYANVPSLLPGTRSNPSRLLTWEKISLKVPQNVGFPDWGMTAVASLWGCPVARITTAGLGE